VDGSRYMVASVSRDPAQSHFDCRGVRRGAA
jgi:hypothetical protein